jgi:hypothetical protein
MENLKTIAVSGAADKRESVLSERLSEQYQMLLFDKDPKALSDIYDSLLANNHNINIEKMSCERQLGSRYHYSFWFCINERVVRKVKKVATAKIIIIMENDDEFTKSIK